MNNNSSIYISNTSRLQKVNKKVWKFGKIYHKIKKQAASLRILYVKECFCGEIMWYKLSCKLAKIKSTNDSLKLLRIYKITQISWNDSANNQDLGQNETATRLELWMWGFDSLNFNQMTLICISHRYLSPSFAILYHSNSIEMCQIIGKYIDTICIVFFKFSNICTEAIY